MIYRGIVLKESLKGCALPSSVSPYFDGEYPYMLDGRIPMTVFRLKVPRDRIEAVSAAVANELQDTRFFANLIGDVDMVVIFPRVWIWVEKARSETADAARALGIKFAIPVHQMSFEKMFEADHPNARVD